MRIGRDDKLDGVEVTRGAVRPLRSCFRQWPPTLSTFDAAWVRNLCLAASSLNDVRAIMQMVSESMGAELCVLLQCGPTRRASVFELLVNVPADLSDDIRGVRIVDDPISVACEQRVAGFAASDLDRLIDMTDRRRATLRLYASHGVPDGFTVPLCVPNEPRAYCSFGFSDSSRLTVDLLGVATFTAPLLFEAARRVLGKAQERRRPGVELSTRQLECVSGLAQGLSNAQIAFKLGLSVQTVHDHLEAARRRFGAANSIELMVQALHSGQLHWSMVTGAVH